jgi:cytochrome oxidase Cu insertion factor (SCO1/SenC/PrrC family)
MSPLSRWLSVVACSVGAGAAILAAGRFLLSPVQGDVLVLASASQPDHLVGSSLQLRSSAGWKTLGTFTGSPVPAAPKTATLLEAKAPLGSYDRLRLGNVELPIRLTVQQNLVAPVLIGVKGGRPANESIYAGGESVSLGLSELSGQLKPVSAFRLVDQFGRIFDNSSIAGHDVILAAFHTTCRQTCPLYTGLFLQIQKQLPPSVLLIETTIDPVTDTPDVLRAYAGGIRASWTFLTGDAAALTDFWKPFDVELGSGEVHRSTLALIDSHGFIRSVYMGAPDVGGSLPSVLADQLDSQGRALLKSRGAGWGQAQVLDTLAAIGGLASPSSNGEGKAPSFTLSTLDGKQIGLADFRGRPVLINFWATYCVPCRVEMPLIEQTAYEHPKLVVLLMDERDSTLAARNFVNQLGITSRVLLDSDGKVGDLYRITGLPTTIFVRADGTIEGRYLGQTNQQILRLHAAAIGA